MLCSLVQVLLVASFSSVLLVQVGGVPRTHVLAGLLRADLANDKDLPHLLLLSFVSELMAAKGSEMLPQRREGQKEVMRRHIPLSQRGRKAGCRNFYWKTFTSC